MPLIDPKKTGRFLNRHEVYNIWNRYNALGSDLESSDSLIRTIMVSRLEELLKTLQTQENAFYAMFNIKDTADIKYFQKRSAEWASTGMNILINKDFINSIFNQIKSEIKVEEVADALNEILNDQLPQNPQDFLPNFNVAQMVEKFFQSRGQNVKFTSSASVGLNARYEIIQDLNSPKGVRIVIKNGAIPKAAEGRLAKIVNETDDLNSSIAVIKMEFEKIKKLIYKSVATYVTDGKALAAFNYELHNRKSNAYNYCTNLFVLQGYLGELYWNAGISYIFNKNGLTLPTGNIKNTSGKSLSVDMILNEVGFQIKSWQSNSVAEKGTHTTTAKRNMGNFIVNNLGLGSSSTLGSILLDMFAAYSYNKPTEDKTLQTEDFAEYQRDYESEYAFIDNNDFTILDNIFTGYLDKIIRIDTGGEIAAGVIDNKEQTEFYNTFWLINDKVFPSSVIIQNIINRLNNRPVSAYVDLQINSIKDTRDPNQTWPAGSGISAQDIDFDPTTMANYVKINYSTTFDLQEILSNLE